VTLDKLRQCLDYAADFRHEKWKTIFLPCKEKIHYAAENFTVLILYYLTALQRGADSLDSSSNPLMFFCDVDLAFTQDFLNQCRAYSSPGMYCVQ